MDPEGEVDVSVDESEAPTPKAEDANSPQVQKSATPDKPQIQQKTNPHNNSLKQKIMTEHLNEDGTIKIHQGTIGNQFQSHLITSSKDNEIGKNKVSHWSKDIQEHKENQKNKRGHINPIPHEFLLARNQNTDAEHLQKKCYNAYKKKNGEDLSTLRKQHNRVTRKREYGAIVGKYCGKPLQETPAGGHTG